MNDAGATAPQKEQTMTETHENDALGIPDKFDLAWAELHAAREHGDIMALHDVQTGGGIWAILFDRWGPQESLHSHWDDEDPVDIRSASTYAVFQDPDQEAGYVVTRHTGDVAFWNCEDPNCPSIKVATAALLADEATLNKLTTECEGLDEVDAAHAAASDVLDPGPGR